MNVLECEDLKLKSIDVLKKKKHLKMISEFICSICGTDRPARLVRRDAEADVDYRDALLLEKRAVKRSV